MSGSVSTGVGRWAGPAAAAVVAAGSGSVAGAGLLRLAPARLDRSAHVGRPVTLAAGPATAVGLVLALAAAGSTRVLPAVLAAAAAGLLDDLAGSGSGAGGVSGHPSGDGMSGHPSGDGPPTRGLAGHLGALSTGRVTTGSVKVAVIGCGALLTAVALGRQPGSDHPGRVRVLADGALVAGTANLVNLLDLRPGRAGKASAAAAVGLLLLPGSARAGSPRVDVGGTRADGTRAAAAVLGAVAAELRSDLAGTWMLGDCGANALGAGLGAAVVAGRGPRVRTVWLLAVLALTVSSEWVSFSAVIEANPALAWLDRLGRPAVTTPPTTSTEPGGSR